MAIGELSLAGVLDAQLGRAHIRRAPLTWRLRNALRWSYIWGWLSTGLARALSALTGLPILISDLRLRHIGADGTITDYGIVGRRVITNAGVAYLVDAWDNRQVNLENLNYHGCGTGTANESVNDTALGSECTTVLNPDSTRASGTRSQPSANIYRTVGTLTFDGSAAVTEHGLFSQAGTGGGTLWDRTVFSAINVVSSDQIQCTYSCTITAGG